MTHHRRTMFAASVVVVILAGMTWAADQPATPAAGKPLKLLPPQPMVPGVKVVTLWPVGSPMLKALDV